MHKHTILIFDRNTELFNNVANTLTVTGYNVFTTNNIESAQGIISNHLPDLVLMNIDFNYDPRTISTFNCYEKLLDRNVPIIYLTNNQFDIQRIIEDGIVASGIINKPFTDNQLLERVHLYFKKSSHQVKLYEDRLDNILGNLSAILPHEFRTSLSGILGFSSLITKMTNNDNIISSIEMEDINDMSRSINEAGKYLQRLTENFLLYSQLSFEKNDPQKVADMKKLLLNNPSEIISDIVNLRIHNSIRSNDITLLLCDSPINISYTMFYKVIYELFDNALKFSKKGESIIVSTSNTNSTYHITIKDSGRGMTFDQINKISACSQFERNVYEQQGTGLGLSIVKEIVDLHGGSFKIESEISKGVTVLLSFPINKHYIDLHSNIL